jgi:pyruvate,water dikinase
MYCKKGEGMPMKTGLKIDIQLWGKQKEGVKKEKCGVSVPEGHVARIVLSGRPASYGTTIGPAAVVMDREDMANVKEGAVIVSKIASATLVAGMSKARAIVAEYGGRGTIALRVARQYGIPAVVGVANLIKTVGDGDYVRVDGVNGVVEVIKPIACRRWGKE